MLKLEDYIALIPDSFLAGKQETGNIYKILKVMINEINKDLRTLQLLRDFKDVRNLFGRNLEIFAQGYGLHRFGLSDAEFLTELLAFISSNALGTDRESILTLMRYLTGDSGLDVQIKEKFDMFIGPPLGDPIDPTLRAKIANPRIRAFDVVLENYKNNEPILRNFIAILRRVKAAGVEVTINELIRTQYLEQYPARNLDGNFITQHGVSDEDGNRIIIELPPEPY